MSSQGPQVNKLVDELARRRLEHLVLQLMQELASRQSLTYGTDDIENVEEWRTAARIAGRRLGSPVSTGVSKDGTKVWASEGP